MKINDLTWIATHDGCFIAWPVMGCKPAKVLPGGSGFWIYKFNGFECGSFNLPEQAMEACNKEHKKLITGWCSEEDRIVDVVAPTVIDLSMFDLNAIEPKKQPDRPGLYWVRDSNSKLVDFGLLSITQKELDSDKQQYDYEEYRFLCDLIPPQPIMPNPPKPEAKIVLADITYNGIKRKWCLKRGDHFFPIDEINSKTGYCETLCRVVKE